MPKSLSLDDYEIRAVSLMNEAVSGNQEQAKYRLRLLIRELGTAVPDTRIKLLAELTAMLIAQLIAKQRAQLTAMPRAMP